MTWRDLCDYEFKGCPPVVDLESVLGLGVKIRIETTTAVSQIGYARGVRATIQRFALMRCVHFSVYRNICFLRTGSTVQWQRVRRLVASSSEARIETRSREMPLERATGGGLTSVTDLGR